MESLVAPGLTSETVSDSERELCRIQAEFCEAMSHPKRVLILCVLKKGERSVNQLGRETGIPQANLSQHLGVMRQQGLLRVRREGMKVFYSVADDRIIQACNMVRQVISERLERTNQLFQRSMPET